MIISTIGPTFVTDKNPSLMWPTWIPANMGRVWWNGLIVDIILGENHLSRIIVTIDLEALKFNGFLSYIFYEFKINEYDLD